MANNPHVSTANRNLGLDAQFNSLNSGFVRIYDGSQPADAQTALSGQVKLAELALSATAFAAAASGSKTANAITSATILATSTATWGTLVNSGGSRAADTVMDFSAGASGCDCNFNSAAFVIGAQCAISTLIVSQAA